MTEKRPLKSLISSISLDASAQRSQPDEEHHAGTTFWRTPPSALLAKFGKRNALSHHHQFGAVEARAAAASISAAGSAGPTAMASLFAAPSGP